MGSMQSNSVKQYNSPSKQTKKTTHKKYTDKEIQSNIEKFFFSGGNSDANSLSSNETLNFDTVSHVSQKRYDNYKINNILNNINNNEGNIENALNDINISEYSKRNDSSSEYVAELDNIKTYILDSMKHNSQNEQEGGRPKSEQSDSITSPESSDKNKTELTYSSSNNTENNPYNISESNNSNNKLSYSFISSDNSDYDVSYYSEHTPSEHISYKINNQEFSISSEYKQNKKPNKKTKKNHKDSDDTNSDPYYIENMENDKCTGDEDFDDSSCDSDEDDDDVELGNLDEYSSSANVSKHSRTTNSHSSTISRYSNTTNSHSSNPFSSTDINDYSINHPYNSNRFS